MNPRILKTFFVPGGVLLMTTAALLHVGPFPVSPAILDFFYAAVFAAGLLLAWRFHSTRVFFTLSTVLLAERALGFFSLAPPAAPAPSRVAFAAAGTILPLNFLIFALAKERGFNPPAVASRLFLVFLESVFVALACRPDHASSGSVFQASLFGVHSFASTPLPPLGVLSFVVVGIALLFRFFSRRKPVECGSFWALISTALAWHAGGLGVQASAYLATAALILAVSVVETSYDMAYRDELTGLPGRRAFNELLLGLDHQYAIAIVDVDHFKNFNDTYGHETGDQVLRMVASRLGAVTGGGKAFRCGGEEFAIVFPGMSSGDAFDHVENVRLAVQHASFKVRGQLDRRKLPRGPEDRRRAVKKKTRAALVRASDLVSVTVSIGVAEPSTKNRNVDQVISAADRALYRAKEAGRNRVELDGCDPKRVRAARPGA